MRRALGRSRSRLYATLTIHATVGALLAGCASGPRGSGNGDDVTRASSALSGAACTGYHAISLESRDSECTGLASSTGRWVGRRVAELAEGVYCSYSWESAPGKSGGSVVRPPTKAVLLQRTPAPTSPRSVGAVPTLQTRLAPTTSVLRTPVKTVSPSNVRVQTTVTDSKRTDSKPEQPSGYPPDHRLLERLERVEIDCPVTASLSPVGPNDPLWLDTHLETHRGQAGWLKELPKNKAKVRVAVIDSAARPFTSNAPDTYDHGRTVGRVIADLGCPLDGKSGCPVEVVNHLALPLVTPDVADYTKGGYYGTRGQLAAALTEALDQWLATREKSGVARLVINLSVGWNERHGGEIRTDFRGLDVASQAVYAALVRASCYGALPIASAGNRSAPGDNGPMYPAGWETVQAPSEKLCAAYGWKSGGNLPVHPTGAGTSYRPLIFAIGGVDAQDEPLSNTRAGAQPRLVGHALAVVAQDPPRGGWTSTLTGTSMAAAVASGVAAAAWGYQPDHPPHDLMEIVYKTAVELKPASGALTEHCLASLGPCAGHPIKRISACETLAYSLGTSATDLGCNTVPAHQGKATPAGTPDAAAYAALAGPATPCAGAGCASVPAGVVPKSEQPWVGPQPGYPSCANCFLLRGWQQIYVGLQPGAELTLSTVMVEIYNGATSPVYELIAGPQGYPQHFMASVPGSNYAIQATLISVHDAGFTSVYVSSEEPVPVY